MVIEKIKHDYWVYKNINGIEYRGKYITYGYSYAQFVIEKQTSITKKKYFFSKIKEFLSWKIIFQGRDKVIDLKEFYDVSSTEILFDKFVPIIVNFTTIVHKNRLENEVQKRNRIINEIIK